MARPTKLTPTLLAKLDTIADDSWSIQAACEHIGIDPATWYRWDANPDAEDQLLARFRELAARVRVSGGRKIEALSWGVLRSAMEDDEVKASDKIAAAAASLRLRTAHRVEVSGPDGGPVRVGPVVDLSRLSVEELRAYHALQVKAEQGGES